MASGKWIVSAKWDLCFFSGSVLITYIYYGVYKLLLLLPPSYWLHQYAEVFVTVLFYAFFDHPHIFQTFSRTHADSTEFARHPYFYTYGLLALIGLGYGILALHGESYFEHFLDAFGIWHILRQNSGFLRLYKKRAGEDLPLDALLDYGLLYGSVGIFLLMRLSHSPKLAHWLPEEMEVFLQSIFGTTLTLYGLRQLYLLQNGRVHLPKLIFLSAIVGTYYFTYVLSQPPFGLLVALETLYHDIQYQGWIIHFQRRRFALGMWKRWLAASLIYGTVFGAFLIFTFLTNTASWFVPPFIMMVLFHYYIDGKIWKFSRNPELRKIFEKDFSSHQVLNKRSAL